MLMHPKPKTSVSKPIRDFARGKDCTLMIPGICNGNSETTVHCHLRMFGLAGINQKPDDIHGVHACSACHDALDRRGSNVGVGWDDILRALMVTQKRLIAAGLIILRSKA